MKLMSLGYNSYHIQELCRCCNISFRKSILKGVTWRGSHLTPCQRGCWSNAFIGLCFKSNDDGIGGAALEWIKALLVNRKQRVMVIGTASEWTNVTSGAPHGSVLGPMLFVLYINDLPDADSNIYMFADDTKLYREMFEVTDVMTLQNGINEMEKWSTEWLMSFQPAKCKVLKMGRPISDLSDVFNPYTLSVHHLGVVDNEKDTGVIIECDLSFDKHIAEKVNKATKIVNIIRRSFLYLDKKKYSLIYTKLW